MAQIPNSDSASSISSMNSLPEYTALYGSLPPYVSQEPFTVSNFAQLDQQIARLLTANEFESIIDEKESEIEELTEHINYLNYSKDCELNVYAINLSEARKETCELKREFESKQNEYETQLANKNIQINRLEERVKKLENDLNAKTKNNAKS